jgi:hypothetical protein
MIGISYIIFFMNFYLNEGFTERGKDKSSMGRGQVWRNTQINQ